MSFLQLSNAITSITLENGHGSRRFQVCYWRHINILRTAFSSRQIASHSQIINFYQIYLKYYFETAFKPL